MSDAVKIQDELTTLADPKRAKLSLRFFKTGNGQYGEHDKFIGVVTSDLRNVAKKFKNIEINEIKQLLTSNIHEHRFVALTILKYQYSKSNHKDKKKIHTFYLKHKKFVNNWDLVDTSAEYLVGDYLRDKPRGLLYKLAKSRSLWDRRIAILATYNFIKHNDFDETLKLTEILLQDKHDLIHKAVGWMLREVGNRSRKIEKKFLDKFYEIMPRTMLRYAIEKFPENERKFYLSKKTKYATNRQHKFDLS